MSFIPQSNNPWTKISKGLLTTSRIDETVDTADGFAYLKYLGLDTAKNDIKVVTKGTKIYLNVDRGDSGTEVYSFPLLSNEKFKKATFIEDIGLLVLYVVNSEVSESATEHPIL